MPCKIFSPAGQVLIRNGRPTAALGLPTGSGRDQAIADIAQQWAEKDPTAAAAYAAALSPGETKDLVITAIARQLTSSDPQTALSWIEKLPDESTRQKALETCVAAVERNRSEDSSGVCSAQQHGRYT